MTLPPAYCQSDPIRSTNESAMEHDDTDRDPTDGRYCSEDGCFADPVFHGLCKDHAEEPIYFTA